jgi:hypothetical protein
VNKWRQYQFVRERKFRRRKPEAGKCLRHTQRSWKQTFFSPTWMDAVRKTTQRHNNECPYSNTSVWLPAAVEREERICVPRRLDVSAIRSRASRLCALHCGQRASSRNLSLTKFRKSWRTAPRRLLRFPTMLTRFQILIWAGHVPER